MLYVPQSLKRCTKCGEWKLNSRREFVKIKDARLANKCKQCQYTDQKKYVQSHREQVAACQREWGAANSQRKKDTDRQYYQRNKEQRLSYRREYRQNNRDRVLETQRRHYRKNKERVNRKGREWVLENKERAKQNHQKWAESNRDYIKACRRQYVRENGELIADGKRRWKRTERGRNSTLAARYRRRARVRGLPSDFTVDDWNFALDYWHSSCCLCGSAEKIEADHWIAISCTRANNPGTVPCNIIPLCHTCNASKGDHDAREWLIRILGPDAAQQKLSEIEQFFASVRRVEKAD